MVASRIVSYTVACAFSMRGTGCSRVRSLNAAPILGYDEMKRIVLGVLAGLSLITVAACGAALPSKECQALIDCSKKASPSTTATYESTYGDKGSCGASAATGDACNLSCKAGLDALKLIPDAGC